MKVTNLAHFIGTHSVQIIAEWEEFARAHVDAASSMDLEQRRDHIAAMLKVIERDLSQPQTKVAQARKSKGTEDAAVGSDTAANSHGSDRAATGFSPVDLVSEFRALRASVLRQWSETTKEISHEGLEEITRFNEAIDQLLVESITKYAHDVDRAKDLFLGVLGHDLRNPLGAIMMSATAMMTKEGSDWPHLKTAARILNAGTRMDGLIGDLVDFTRTRLGSGIPVTRIPMDMETICRQTVDEMIAFHPGCEVRFEATGDLHGEWDIGRIGQALSNLIGNAFQHGAEGEPIQVVATSDANSVVLSVHNRGKRIPQSHLHDIFEPFKQLESTTTKATAGRSVGLGLFIVQAIVLAHRGSIDVKSSAEGGTTFTARLPRHVASTAPSIVDRGVGGHHHRGKEHQ